MEKRFLFCPHCGHKHEVTKAMKSWSGMRCDDCGDYFVIKEQKEFTESELENE